MEEDPDLLCDVWFCNETDSFFCVHVKSENNGFLGAASSEELFHRSMHSAECTVWMAISKHGIIEPYWFGADKEVVIVK